MTARPFVTSAEVAAIIGYTGPAAFMANRARLEAETLFPLPMPTHSARAYRWRRDEVEAWVARNGLPRVATTSNLHLLRLARTA